MIPIGILIGLSKQNYHHQIGVYIGNDIVIIIYEHSLSNIHSSFDRIEYFVRNEINLGKLLNSNFIQRNLIQLQSESFEITISNLDVFSDENFFEIMRHNFNEMNSLQLGDVIFFQRGHYDHGAIMYNFQKFEIIHKNTVHELELVIRSQIINGNQNDHIDGEIRTNYLLDVIYNSKIVKMNKYDKRYPPL